MSETPNVSMKVYALSDFELSDRKIRMAFHEHATMELSYVIGGEMVSYSVGLDHKERAVQVVPHQLLILFPNVKHRSTIPNSLHTITIELAAPLGNDLMHYLFSSEYVMSFPQARKLLSDPSGVVLVNDVGSIQTRMLALNKYAKGEGNMTQIEKAEYDLDLKRFFLEVLTCEKTITDNSRYNIFIKRALSFIEDSFDQDLSLDNVAKAVGISSSYLRRLFQENLHSSIKAMVNSIRIEKSCRFLAETALPIKDVATSVGYKSTQVFNANFQKKMKTTPRKYRKTMVKPRNLLFMQPGPERGERIYLVDREIYSNSQGRLNGKGDQ